MVFVIPYRKPTVLERYISCMVEKPSSTVSTALDTFINGMISDGDFHKFTAFWICCLHTEQASRLNLINPRVFTLLDSGTAPTWVSGIGGAGGFTANGAVVSTQVTFGTNSLLAGTANENGVCALFDSGTSGQSVNNDMGNSNTLVLRARTTTDTAGNRVSDATTETIASGVTDGSGLCGWERDSATNKVFYRAGSAVGNVTRNTGTGSTTTISILGNTGGSVSIRRCRIAALGGPLGAAGHSRVNARVVQFRTDIGCT